MIPQSNRCLVQRGAQWLANPTRKLPTRYYLYLRPTFGLVIGIGAICIQAAACMLRIWDRQVHGMCDCRPRMKAGRSKSSWNSKYQEYFTYVVTSNHHLFYSTLMSVQSKDVVFREKGTWESWFRYLCNLGSQSMNHYLSHKSFGLKSYIWCRKGYDDVFN